MRELAFLIRPAAIAAALVLSGIPVFGADVPGLTTVRIVEAGQDIDAEAFYAQDLGIFKKYGINSDITILRKGGGAVAVSAVAGGAADIGEGDIISSTNAHQRGIPIVLIAPSGIFRSTVPTTEVIVAKNSPIQSAKDLEGKSIALISPEGPSRIATNVWLENAGVALDKMSFIELPAVEMAANVERGTVAAAVVNEPSLVASQTCCRVLANNFQSVGNVWQLNAWYSTSDWVSKNAAIARKFAQAIREAAQWANNPVNHAKSGEILAKYTPPFPPELLPKMNRATYGETLDPKTMQPILAAALKYKAIQSAADPK